jgi:hypothetical protein
LTDGPRSCDCHVLEKLDLEASTPRVEPGSVWFVARVVSHGQLMYTLVGYLPSSCARFSWQVEGCPPLTGRITTSQLRTPSSKSTTAATTSSFEYT